MRSYASYITVSTMKGRIAIIAACVLIT